MIIAPAVGAIVAHIFRTIKMDHLVLYSLLLLITYAGSQDCIDYGKRCSETGQCCGGCCIEGVCIDTYRSCQDLRGPCQDHYCPAGMECTVFRVENCLECEAQPLCS